MAQEELGQTRTEAPTPRRREEARQQGQVAFSTDLTTGLMLLAGVGALALVGPGIARGLLNTMRWDLLHIGLADLDPEKAQSLFLGLFGRGMEIIGVFLAVVVVLGVAAPALQVGFQVAPGLLALNLGRLSPAQGWSRLFSLGAGFRGLIAILKVTVIAVVAYWVVRGRAFQIAGVSEAPLGIAAGQAWGMVLRLGLAVAGALVVIGVADYCYQLWKLEQSLRMTRQELKEEMKREEGNPEIKARIRKLQREAAQKRMFQDVPRASVVVTNPTHLAVALRYERGTAAAPKVVAKGAGYVAQRIVDMARRHAVPVVERKPLAQALYKAVKIGQEIPATLYLVVAEVLAYVYRLRGVGVDK
jgi:flagellar biosynthetic protein FlhB